MSPRRMEEGSDGQAVADSTQQHRACRVAAPAARGTRHVRPGAVPARPRSHRSRSTARAFRRRGGAFRFSVLIQDVIGRALACRPLHAGVLDKGVVLHDGPPAGGPARRSGPAWSPRAPARRAQSERSRPMAPRVGQQGAGDRVPGHDLRPCLAPRPTRKMSRPTPEQPPEPVEWSRIGRGPSPSAAPSAGGQSCRWRSRR